MTKLFHSIRLAGELLCPRPVKWLGVVVAACAAGGCLIPQDDTYLAGLPEAKNRPPRIVETQVQPTKRIVQDFGAAGVCELDFSVIVEDPDVDNLLTVRWYIDYDPLNPTGPYREVQLQNNGQALRGDRPTLHINLRAANSPLAGLGPHLVEALVSDSRLAGREPVSENVPLGDGGFVVNPGYAVTYAWFVTTVQGDCQ